MSSPAIRIIKESWMIPIGGKLQQTNKNDVRKDLFVSSPTSTVDEKISLLLEEIIASKFVDGVARCCSMLFGWLLHLGSW